MCKELFLAACSVIIIGCSVREDREKCPCEIVLDFSQEMKRENLIITAVTQNGEFLIDDSITRLEDSLYSFYIKSSEKIYIAVASYPDGFPINLPPFQLPHGLDYYKQYAYFSAIEPKGVLVKEEIYLHKNYCGIEISFVSHTLEGADEMGISGNICGYNMDGSPMDGSFSCLKEVENHPVVSIRVPRQKDNSLELSIYSEGKKIASFALGEHIASLGYDWTAKDLDDIKIEIDLIKKLIHLDSDLWSASKYYKLEL